VYEGEWIDDMIEGSGRYSYADKSYYQVGHTALPLLPHLHSAHPAPVHTLTLHAPAPARSAHARAA